MIIENEVFQNENFVDIKPSKADYDNCEFINCRFRDLANLNFTDCRFTECELSNVSVKDSSFKDVEFIQSKMLGIKFYECNPFLLQLTFTACRLDYSSFYKLPLKNVTFQSCQLIEVDFTEGNLQNAAFEQCDLGGAIFEQCNLEKADFSTSHSYQIDPDANQMKNAKFSRNGLSGLLQKYKLKII